MSDDLRPALSPDEWAVVLRAFANPPHPESLAAGIGIGDPAERALAHLAYSRDEAVRRTLTIAVHNAALPDGHPAKITRAMVGDFAAIVAAYDHDEIHGEALARMERALRHLAAFRALLPPEPADDA